MGERVARPRSGKAVAAKEEQGANDLEVLHPNRSATIAGREVVVREYGFVEGMKMLGMLEPFLADLKQLMVDDQPLTVAAVTGLLGQHMDVITDAVAVAADVEVEWLVGLSQDDGYHLMMLWWTANGPFYIRTARNRIFADRVERARATVGQTSTQP